MPSSWLSQYLPVKARSVPCSRVTRYCSGVSFLRHSSFDWPEAAVLMVVLVSMSGFSLSCRPDMGMAADHCITQVRETPAGRRHYHPGATLGTASRRWSTADVS